MRTGAVPAGRSDTGRRGWVTRLVIAALAAASMAVPGATATALAAAPGGADAVPQGNPADGVLNMGDRTLDFDRGWRFQLVNTADTHGPDRGLRQLRQPARGRRGLRRLGVAVADAPARLEHRAVAAAGEQQRHRLLPGRPGLVPARPSPCPPRWPAGGCRWTSTACT